MSDDKSTSPSSPAPVSNPDSKAPTDAKSAALDTSKTQSPDSKVEAKTPSASPSPEKRKYKVKIDKDELEVDEDELLRGYQLRQASDKRFKEAAKAREEAEKFLELLKSDPRKVLSHPSIGHDVRKLAETILAEELEQEFMDPKEKELRQLRKEKEELAATVKAREEAERKAKEDKEVASYQEAYAKDIQDTIKSAGLPMNNHTINAFRDYMLLAMENGIEDVKASDVLSDVKKDYEDAIRGLFSNNDLSTIISAIGEDGLKKIREYDMGRLKDPKGKKVAKEEQPPVKPDREERLSVPLNDYFAQLRKKVGD